MTAHTGQPTIAEALPDRGLVLLLWPDGRKTLHTTARAQQLLDTPPPASTGSRHDQVLAEPAELLMPHQAASILRVDPKTLARWVAAGKLTAIRTLKGQRRYLPADIHRLRTEGAT